MNTDDQIQHGQHSFGPFAPTTDIVQDHPTAWDWRLVVGFIVVGVVAFYWR